MGKDLVVVESPAKARTIERILGGEYTVLSSMGHVRDLPEKRLGIDVKNGFNPTYQIGKARKNVMQDLISAVKKSSTTYLATDPDREGEAIAWHLFEVLKAENAKTEFKRVTFHEITRPAVLAAFDHPGEINMNVVDSQQARRVLDRLVGYKVSPLLWREISRKARSAGRVQSVALRLVCERESEIDKFVPQEYWNFTALFAKSATKEEFPTKLHHIDGKAYRVENAETAMALCDDAEKGEYAVNKISDTAKSKRPSPPFITSTLQQAASANLRFSARQTMVVAQQLYEGIDTGSGPTGLITYMRTDSVNVSDTARTQACEVIEATFGKDYVPEKPNVYKSNKGAQEAHEAIRPTDISLTPANAEKILEKNQGRLYRLIWNRFVASQMAAARFKHHTVDIKNKPGTCQSEFTFRVTTTETVFAGYQKVYDLSDVEAEKKSEKAVKLPKLDEGENCDLKDLEKTQKFTEPPPRFSEATLVRELESNGIGRPSTYAAILGTIVEREYVGKEKGRLIPSELGRTVCDYLVSNVPELFEVSFTAKMESELDTIEQGNLDWQEMLGSFYEKLSVWLTVMRSTLVPESDVVNGLMSAFPDSIEWAPPEKKGRRTYDDREFLLSLKEQVESGKQLTNKQWKALLILAVRYEDQIPGLKSLATKFDLESEFAEIREKIESRNNGSNEPDENDLRLCDCLESVKDWQTAVGRGKRVYDDKKFYTSVAGQARDGRKLSDAQVRALKKLIIKYSAEIGNFEALSKEFDLTAEVTSGEPDKNADEINLLLGLAAEISKWKEPSESAKGRKFDEKEFIASLATQFKQKNRLSSRQLYSLRKVINSHKDQISDFEERTSKFKV